MRKYRAGLHPLVGAVVWASLLTMAGCGSMFGSSSTERITAPSASTSPKMDFEKIRTIAVFPLFPAGQVDEQQFAESLVAELTAEVAKRQSQWTIQSYRETLGFINAGDLGSGYKNLQADYNTFGGPGGQMVVSPATREFLGRLSEVSGADAFIIGSYNLGTSQTYDSNPFTGTLIRYVDSCEVRLSVYYVREDENWWTASVTRAGDRGKIIASIAQSLGAYMGKGTLRQL